MFEITLPARAMARSAAVAIPAPAGVALAVWPAPEAAADTIDWAKPEGKLPARAACSDAAIAVTATVAAAEPFLVIRTRNRASARVPAFLAPSRDRPSASPNWRTVRPS